MPFVLTKAASVLGESVLTPTTWAPAALSLARFSSKPLISVVQTAFWAEMNV
jgi:hypothetical protein